MPALITFKTPVLADWVDYNGHLRDAFYLLIFSFATDAFMDRIGLASDDRDASGHSLFTLEAHINFLHEVKLGEVVEVRTQIIGHDRKRVQLYHGLYKAEGDVELAASEQMLLHVDLAAGPKSAPFSETSLQALRLFTEAQRDQPDPMYVGRVIGLPK
ncbi:MULTISPECIES: thioesterase family protein [unclassified Pseudomonas]|uniref:thioesterase family protein n=1 Tax=unclassified Pseudomonas TaxID=196821 RepID=UPI00177F0EC2|nr:MULTISPECIES: thioesterase family protein [unclassified Pseudomonas]MBD8707690.1 thioesterase family protein [Pseudomonas sp. CFBP 13711]MBD8713348.1 thioesterase family protein [Pseudomonas sp. CFBP 13715]